MGLRLIRQEGDDMLKKISKPVKDITPSVLSLVDDMLETLRAKDGVGLAAPQVGVLKRVAVIEHEDELYELINPEIIEQEGSQVCNEACLSVPGRAGDIDRPMTVTVQALNREGEIYSITVDDFMASVFCHEIDHLDGILFLDNATNVKMITKEQMAKRKKERKERLAKGRQFRKIKKIKKGR